MFGIKVVRTFGLLVILHIDGNCRPTGREEASVDSQKQTNKQQTKQKVM